MRKLNIGIIGLGVGEKHVLAFKEHPTCEVVSLCDFADEKLSNSLGYCRDVKITNQADVILDDPAIDIVSIASYDNYHFEQVVRAIRNGKHVFVEKPLCLNVQEATVIRRLLSEKPGIRLSSNLNLRTCPRFLCLKDTVLSGAMGRIFYLEGDYLWGRIHKLLNGWRKNMDFYSIVYGAAVHMIDLLMWLTETKPVEVQGYGSRLATRGSGFRFNDFASILMKFENGMVAKVSANGGCVHPHFHRVTVFGTKKSFVHDFSDGKWFESCDPKDACKKIVDEYPAAERKGEVITSFVDSIIDEKLYPIVSNDDVFATMSVCFAAEKAIQTGKAIQVEYI
jgi:predicted dehydrogenase